MKIDKLNENNKKKTVFLILTLILSLGISLAAIYFIYTYHDTRENTLTTALIDLEFTEDENLIDLTTVPVLDEVGIRNTPYTFSVKNKSQVPINAKIGLDIDNLTDIDIGAIRYAFYIDDKLILKDNIKDDLVLYTIDNMQVNEELNCKLVFWVDYYYTEGNTKFIAKIKAVGESFDYIP